MGTFELTYLGKEKFVWMTSVINLLKPNDIYIYIYIYVVTQR